MRDSMRSPNDPRRVPLQTAGGGGRAAFRQVLPRLIFGFGLAAAGLLFTLDNLDVLEASEFLRYWPVLLILFGVALLGGGSAPSDRIGGSIWIALGGALLLDNLDYIDFDLWDLWPLGLIAAGGSLVWRAMRPAAQRSGAASDDASVHAFAMMSGVVRKNASLGFQGGTANAIMGGVEIDLRGASLDGGRATLDCFAMWGGIEITVPPHWTVVSHVLPLMGGVDDKTRPPAPEDATGELVLTGTAIMGGIAVKN